MCSSTRRAGERHTGLIARAEGLGVILRTRKTKKRSAQGPGEIARKEARGKTGVGGGSSQNPRVPGQ